MLGRGRYSYNIKSINQLDICVSLVKPLAGFEVRVEATIYHSTLFFLEIINKTAIYRPIL